MGEKIVLLSGLLYDGTTEQEQDFIKNSYPDKDVVVLMVRPGEAHIKVYERETTD